MGTPADLADRLTSASTDQTGMDLLRLTTAGSVDDGKSTLIGRLLYDSKTILADQLEHVESTSKARGDEHVDLALVTDGLRAEREQGITIDVAYRYFATSRRQFIIADTPGHVQYTRNMVTGASTSNLAIVLADARTGLTEQSRRHAFIASLLGIPHLVLAVNKMDLVGWSEQRFEEIRAEFEDFSGKLEVADVTFIPISALHGDNVVERSANMGWYQGTPLLYHLEHVHIASDRNLIDPRFPVQWAIRPRSDAHHDYRGYAGRVAGGVLRPGDPVVALPSGLESTIEAIDTLDGPAMRPSHRCRTPSGSPTTSTHRAARCWPARPTGPPSARTSTRWCAGWPAGRLPPGRCSRSSTPPTTCERWSPRWPTGWT